MTLEKRAHDPLFLGNGQPCFKGFRVGLDFTAAHVLSFPGGGKAIGSRRFGTIVGFTAIW